MMLYLAFPYQAAKVYKVETPLETTSAFFEDSFGRIADIQTYQTNPAQEYVAETFLCAGYLCAFYTIYSHPI